MEDFANALNTEIPELMLEAAITGKSLIQNRIQERGLNSSEQPLGVYSELSKKIRTSKGYQIGHVDLTFSGRMWANIGVISTRSKKDTYIVTIGAKSSEDKKKLSDNVERFKEVLNISQSEKEELELVTTDRLERLAKKYLK